MRHAISLETQKSRARQPNFCLANSV